MSIGKMWMLSVFLVFFLATQCQEKSRLNDAPAKDDPLNNNQATSKLEQKQLANQSELIVQFFRSCQAEVGEWISLPANKSLETALYECYVIENTTQLLSFYSDLAIIGSDMTAKHIDSFPSLLRKYKYVRGVLTCLSWLRQFQNKYMVEKKKLKYMLQFIKAHPQHTKDVFPQHRNFSLIGQRTCYFLKVLFQYYYVEVVSSEESLSSSFMRALTLRSDIFDHYDLAYCLSVDSIGKLSSSLEDIDINNVFIKGPQVFQHLKYLSLKDQCRNDDNLRLLRQLRERMDGMDMFKIMYNEYQPFVNIATEKFGHTQVRMLARQFALILGQREKYIELSKKLNQESQL